MTLKKALDDVDSIKTKWNIWWKSRYEVSGWGWDETTQLFLASPEQWERYIEVCYFYPNLRQSLTYEISRPILRQLHPLLSRDLLAELFKGTVAGGKEAVSIHLMTRQMDAAKNCNDSLWKNR